MLSLKGFLPSSDKVRQVDFHPTQPWILAATKSDQICVWDWLNQQVLHEVQLGQVGEEELVGDAELARLHLRDPAVAVNPSALAIQPPSTRTPTGKVRDVRFLDADVASAQLANNHLLASGSGSPVPSSVFCTGLQGQRLVVIVGEAKVLIWDLVAGRLREVPKAALEGSKPTCAAFLFLGGQASPSPGGCVLPSPILAIGCADGIVRLLHLTSLRTFARLVSPHKSSLTSLTVTGVRGVTWEAVIGCFQGGSITMWEPLAKPIGAGLGTVLDISPKADAKVHDKEVVGCCVVAVNETPDLVSRMVMTAGVDGRVYGLDPATLRELTKTKVEPKPTCMTYMQRGFVASGSHCLLVGTEAGVLLGIQPTTGSTRLSINLGNVLPAGHKKAPKVYWAAVHPLQPQLVAVGTNTGAALLRLDALLPLPAAALPLRAPAQVISAGGSGVTYVTAMGDSVYCVTAGVTSLSDEPGIGASASTRKPAAPADSDPLNLLGLDDNLMATTPTASGLLNSLLAPTNPNGQQAPNGSLGSSSQAPLATNAVNKPVAVQLLGSMKIASGKPTTRAVLGVSHDGSYVSCCWPQARAYAIFRQGAANWEEVSSGSGTSVAWHACEARFAVVEEPLPPAAALPGSLAAGKGGKGGSKKDKKEAEKARAAEAAAQAQALAASSPPSVQIKACSGRGVSHVLRASGLGSETPVSLIGGPLLGITLKKRMSSASALVSGSEPPSCLALMEWDTGRRLGPDLPEPLAMSWDPSLSLVALAYSAQVTLCSVQPSLQVVATLGVPGVTSMSWGMRSLFLLSPSHVHAAFVALPPARADSSPGGPSGVAAGGGLLGAFEMSGPAAAAAQSNLLGGVGGVVPPISVYLTEVAALDATPLPLNLGPVSRHAAPETGLPFSAALLAACGHELLAPPLLKPPGHLALLGPRDGAVWLLHATGQPLALPLSAAHAGARAFLMAAAGDTLGAVQLASREVSSSAHDSLAAMVVSVEGARGAQAALNLPGLSLRMEARLRLVLRQWPQAMEAAEALLAGYTQRPPPSSFTYPASNAAFGPATPSHLRGAGQFNGLTGGPLDLGSLAPIPSAKGLTYPGDFDWTSPLRSASTSAAARAAAQAAAGAGPTHTAAGSSAGGGDGIAGGVSYVNPAAPAPGLVPPPSVCPSVPTLDLALALAEGLLSVGMQDAVRHWVRLLSQYARHMTTPQLGRLLAAMAEVGLRQELGALSGVVGVPGAPHGPGTEGAALLAAALSGHSTLLADTLRQSGAHALAATHARAFNLGFGAAGTGAAGNGTATASPVQQALQQEFRASLVQLAVGHAPAGAVHSEALPPSHLAPVRA